jgi:hypothetical protein
MSKTITQTQRYFLMLHDSDRVDTDASIEIEEQDDVLAQNTVRCKNCGYVITTPGLAIEPHEHTFRNPAGFSFHVLCYSDAPGAADVGTATSEACWFPGYSWTFAMCRQCRCHLGWWYSGPDRFAGLISTRLIL